MRASLLETPMHATKGKGPSPTPKIVGGDGNTRLRPMDDQKLWKPPPPQQINTTAPSEQATYCTTPIYGSSQGYRELRALKTGHRMCSRPRPGSSLKAWKPLENREKKTISPTNHRNHER
jgi:hypothetical protein